MPLRVWFDENEVKQDDVHSKGFYASEPTVFYEIKPHKRYTIVMFDVDAPFPWPKNTKSPLVHWLVTNLRPDVSPEGNVVLPYIPPNPPQESPPHTYYIQLLDQPEGGDMPDPAFRSRERFPLDALRSGLRLIGQIGFRSIVQ